MEKVRISTVENIEVTLWLASTFGSIRTVREFIEAYKRVKTKEELMGLLHGCYKIAMFDEPGILKYTYSMVV